MALGVVWAIALSLKQLPPYYRAATLIKQADTLVKQGRDKDAVEFYAQVLDLVPTSKRARMGMAMAYFKSPQEEDRKKGLAAIKGLSFEDDEWKKLAAVMPPEYQRLYKVEKK
jgi:thioredoxin-like negative regulator of GroEL